MTLSMSEDGAATVEPVEASVRSERTRPMDGAEESPWFPGWMLAGDAVALFACDRSGRLTFVNRLASDLTGLTVGKGCWSALEWRQRPRLRRLLRHDLERPGGPSQVEIEAALTDREGNRHDVRLRVVPNPAHGESAHSYLGCFTVPATPRETGVGTVELRTDSLTGLLCRDVGLELLDERLADERWSQIAVLFLDLDGFKAINDSFGHEAGDELLRAVAGRLRAGVREGDLVMRLGGDEFLVGTSTRFGNDPMGLALRLAEAVREPIAIGNLSLGLTTSIGVAIHGEGERDLQALIGEADLAMYEAKSAVDDSSVRLAGASSRRRVTRRNRIEADFVTAWRNGEISLAYQPIRRLVDQEVLGAEAFLRWTHPELGPVGPTEFLPSTRGPDVIATFTEWALATTASEWRTLRDRYPKFGDKAVSFNVDPCQVMLDGFIDMHRRILDANGLRTVDIILEVQDSQRRNGEGMTEALRTLAGADIPVALDYFGVGYNALEHIQSVSVIGCKVARSLTVALAATDRRDREAAEAVLDGLLVTAGRLGLMTLVEGIERSDQLERCIELGIYCGQGYALGRPQPLYEFEAAERRRDRGDRGAATDAADAAGSALVRNPSTEP